MGAVGYGRCAGALLDTSHTCQPHLYTYTHVILGDLEATIQYTLRINPANKDLQQRAIRSPNR